MVEFYYVIESQRVACYHRTAGDTGGTVGVYPVTPGGSPDTPDASRHEIDPRIEVTQLVPIVYVDPGEPVGALKVRVAESYY